MSTFFRLALIFVSVLFFGYVIHKIRKSQLQIEHSIFWVALSFLFILFSIFPGLVQWLTHLCGMVAPVNFLFLVIKKISIMIFHNNKVLWGKTFGTLYFNGIRKFLY